MKAFRQKRAWHIPEEDPSSAPSVRRCDHPGCAEAGEYRAPRSRASLHEYYWFCLEHVRAYNASWDYYKGLSAEQIESEIRTSTTWERPTWPLGRASSHRRFQFDVNDPFEVYGENTKTDSAQSANTPEASAMRILELTPPLTLAALKARYKQLVKRHHPDANGGDKDAEERFKDINQAYRTLLDSLGA